MWIVEHFIATKKLRVGIKVQLNLAITVVKGLINFICYRRIFVIANIRKKEIK